MEAAGFVSNSVSYRTEPLPGTTTASTAEVILRTDFQQAQFRIFVGCMVRNRFLPGRESGGGAGGERGERGRERERGARAVLQRTSFILFGHFGGYASAGHRSAKEWWRNGTPVVH